MKYLTQEVIFINLIISAHMQRFLRLISLLNRA